MAIAVDQLITPDIARPARYLGNELGAVHKPWDSATIRWVLTYPEVYEVGASNLGHIILYSILNQQPRQLCDRAYLPGPDLAQKLTESHTPLFAVEARRSLIDFDILGFSLSYELGATNILEMLTLARIPLTWQERNHDGPWNESSWPIIFAGGQTATSNPEPYADFFDFIALGDGEELLPEIGLVLEEGKNAGMSRQEILLDLAQVPGVYVPQFYAIADDGSVQPNRDDVPPRILRRVATPIPDYAIGLVPHVQTVHDRLTIEIRRGCTRGCRFCQPGMLTRPARDVAPEQVIDTIERGMRATGYDEFSLLSLSCSDYLALPAVGVEVKNRLKHDNVSLSLPSQRVDRFDENIAHIIGGTRKTGLTFAPEAGTQRMRDIINKGLTNEELLRGVKTAHEQGWDKVKLYFMIGLPGETDVDVLGIAETIQWLRRECRIEGRRSLNFNITVSNFTPKPHTPFQWHSVSTSEFERKQAMLKEVFRSIRGVKVNFTDVRISAMEDFVGRGDRRLAAVVRRAWELGAGMDAWWESLERAFNAWTQAIDDAGLTWKYRQVAQGEWNLDESLAHQPSNEQPSNEPEALGHRIDQWKALMAAPLPWDHIDTGIDKTWLQEDLHRALEAATVPDCSFEGCSHCGVCGTDFGHNIVIPPLPIPSFEGHGKPKSERIQRLRVTLGKLGDMALIGHLDLARMLDRAVRRAALPISFTGGFHPGPRIAPANALALGATSTGEVIDFELTEQMDVADFRQRLKDQLSDTLPIYDVQTVDIKAPSATKALDQADYLLAITSDEDHDLELWQLWIDQILATDEIPDTHITKSGKVKQINLRERLHKLEIVTTLPSTLPPSVIRYLSTRGKTVVRYVGSCRNDGNMLRPEQLIHMLERQQEQAAPLHLGHVHRQRLILN
ncbi:TIGR03960 family B12-binding radical SAM protein [Leptothoe sp. PORK10 BA2]|uniref:TIGR03960 family B12-binding radical SAM protein n=1 Tax=Leptothoe sp. PORK10 BA2 TaxID=3110254 RepID=UPI002B2057FE|nr:TIGR03960 family B12-binding radical SAM protein [Leptothoe sp. PORK10 BA2]MEA5462248.1 TIGR03960 family B12-binding radical SAM protein [Leptothoe sp. PORK10 BA2]